MLVRNNSQYHYERHPTDTDKESEIYEGTLPPAGTEVFRKLMQAEELRHLRDESEPNPHITKGYDDLRINIRREEAWQTVNFRDAAVRKPFTELLDPVLQLMHTLPQQLHTALTEDAGRNNCLPPGPLELKSRSNQTDGAVQTAAKSFLMRFAVDHILAGDATGTCVIVYRDGQFHREQKKQSPRTAVKSYGFEGSLSETELHELQVLLESADLKNAQHDTVPGATFYEGTITRVVIPRGKFLQRLIFAAYEGRLGGFGQGYINDNDRVIRPLRQWVNHTIQKRNASAEMVSESDDCAPAEKP